MIALLEGGFHRERGWFKVRFPQLIDDYLLKHSNKLIWSDKFDYYGFMK